MLAQGEMVGYDVAVTDVATGENVYDAIAGQVATFRENYAAWTEGDGAADVDRMGVELDALRVQLTDAQHGAYAAGDLEGFRALGVAVAELDAVQAEQRKLAGEISRWGSTWDTVAGWLASLSATFGLGAILLPLGVTVVVAVSAIAALAWVVTTWQTTRARTNLLKDLADRMTRGELTPEQVETLAKEGGGGWFTGLGTVGVLVLVGGAALLLIGRR